jgi:signal transduction histidine kinase
MITEKKRAEEALARTNDELRTLNERLREFDQLKSQFFANVSHELRTPLALILGPAERLLGAAGRSEGEQRDLDVIRRNARLLLKHVNDLLDLAKLDAHKMGVRHAETDLARLVRRDASLFDALAHERGIAYSVEAPQRLIAQVDAEKVERVVMNLLSNAFKFTPPGRPIRVSLSAADDRAHLDVHDGGPGVPADQRAGIFERFRQTDGASTRQAGGTGLGLAIVKEFAELHGGTVAVGESDLGGARFTVELPLAALRGAAADAAVDRPLEPPPSGEAPAAADRGNDPHGDDDSWTATDAAALVGAVADDLRPRTGSHAAVAASSGQEDDGDEGDDRPLVLVVEDNPELNRFLAETLAPDYRVATAFDGEAGLALALELGPDLVMTDIMMPRMSGDVLVRELRAHAAFDATPVLVLTAKADDELRVELLRTGAQDYVMKPFAAAEVQARVRNLVATKRAGDVLRRESAGAHHDLAALAGEVAAQKRRAEAANHAKTRFLATMSHELRTPLNAIAGYAQLLEMGLDGVVTEGQRAKLERITRSQQHLVRLIADVLDFARLEEGQLRVTMQDVQLRQVLAEAEEAVAPEAAAKGLTLEVCRPDEGVTVRADHDRLRQILLNLLGNAVKFTPASGSVTLTCERTDGELAIRVTDTGPGIPADYVQSVFTPFSQADQGLTREAGGVGLGLAISRELSRAMGAELRVESPPGAGATFRLTFHDAASVSANARA